MITPAYAELNAKLMELRPSWATGGHRHADVVRELITRFKASTVLDFGCGKGTLGNVVMGRDKQNPPAKVFWFDYDPAIPRWSAPPEPADLVVSTHALEHVEPALLPPTLVQLQRLTRVALYVAVPHTLSAAILPDGRNAHLTTEPPDWWEALLAPLGRRIERLPPTLTRSGVPRDETRFVVIK